MMPRRFSRFAPAAEAPDDDPLTDDEAADLQAAAMAEYARLNEQEIDQARHFHAWEMARADVAGGVGDEVPFD